MTQTEYIYKLLKENPNAYIVGSLGNICKDLDQIDHDYKIPIRGAMGHAVGVGFGISLNTDKDVIVLIGDGSFLMKMGSMSTVLKYNRPNLRIIILDNGCYNSCGGQHTNFDAVRNLIPFHVEQVS